MGSQRVTHSWTNLALAQASIKKKKLHGAFFLFWSVKSPIVPPKVWWILVIKEVGNRSLSCMSCSLQPKASPSTSFIHLKMVKDLASLGFLQASPSPGEFRIPWGTLIYPATELGGGDVSREPANSPLPFNSVKSLQIQRPGFEESGPVSKCSIISGWTVRAVFKRFASASEFIACSCCSVPQSCPTLDNSMDDSSPAFPVLHYLPELAQVHDHWVSDAIQPSHPLSSPSPPAFSLSQHQGSFLMSCLLASGGQRSGVYS